MVTTNSNTEVTEGTEDTEEGFGSCSSQTVRGDRIHAGSRRGSDRVLVPFAIF